MLYIPSTYVCKHNFHLGHTREGNPRSLEYLHKNHTTHQSPITLVWDEEYHVIVSTPVCWPTAQNLSLQYRWNRALYVDQLYRCSRRHITPAWYYQYLIANHYLSHRFRRVYTRNMLVGERKLQNLRSYLIMIPAETSNSARTASLKYNASTFISLFYISTRKSTSTSKRHGSLPTRSIWS